jgi:hypothetical protein
MPAFLQSDVRAPRFVAKDCVAKQPA